MDDEKLNLLLSDQAFTSRLAEFSDAQEIVSCLSERGITMSVSDARMLLSALQTLHGEEQELSDDVLEYVAGGNSGYNWLRVLQVSV